MSAASIGEAQVRQCSVGEPATMIERLSIEVVLRWSRKLENESLSLEGGPRPLPLTKVGDRWSYRLWDSQLTGPLPVGSVLEFNAVENAYLPRLTLKRDGWTFVPLPATFPERQGTEEQIDGVRRCVAHLLYDGIPWRRLKVAAIPTGVAVPVECGAACAENAATDFDTLALPASDAVTLIMKPTRTCTYPIRIAPDLPMYSVDFRTIRTLMSQCSTGDIFLAFLTRRVPSGIVVVGSTR